MSAKKQKDNPFKSILLPKKEARLTPSKYTWAEDSVLYTEDTKESQFLSVFISKKKRYVLMGIILCGFLLLFARLSYIQIAKGEEMLQLSMQNKLKREVIVPHRGIIYDKYGKALVRNLPDFYLELIPAYLPKQEHELNRFLIELGEIVQKDPNFLKKELKLDDYRTLYSYQPKVLKEHLDYESALKLKIQSTNLPGVGIKTSSQREYLLGMNNTVTSLSHLLGYVGRLNEKEYEQMKTQGYYISDQIGKTGIERFYETQLKGKNGFKFSEVNAIGQELQILDIQESVSGNDIYLTIDSDFQGQVQHKLTQFLEEKKFEKGIAIVMNPKDFSVLSMVSIPAYDNNEFAKGISPSRFQELLSDPLHPLFHRAVQGTYPPGSTFKLVVSAAALQEGIISPHTSVESVGGIRVGQWFFPDWRAGGHGITNVVKAIAQSVNTFYYIVGGGYQGFEGLGIERLNAYASLIGLGKATGIDLPSEQSGLIPTPQWKQKTLQEMWYVGDTYHASIGQGYVSVTPLQVASFTAFLANGGTVYKPHLLQKIVNANDEVIPYIPEIVNAHIIEEKHIHTVKQGMRQAVTHGSAARLYRPDIAIAAKTGTAQFSSVKKEHSWLTGFAPYDDPEIVVTVLIEEGGEGSESAIEVAKHIFDIYFSTYRVKEY